MDNTRRVEHAKSNFNLVTSCFILDSRAPGFVLKHRREIIFGSYPQCNRNCRKSKAMPIKNISRSPKKGAKCFQLFDFNIIINFLSTYPRSSVMNIFIKLQMYFFKRVFKRF